MKPFYEDLSEKLYCMDFRKNDLPDEIVQMVCTSPPYWGLRKYSGEQELIWGDNHCEHQWGAETVINTGRHDVGNIIAGHQTRTIEPGAQRASSGSFCFLCNAWKGAFGLEPTPEMYVQHTIEILREIRRVLRKDGVVFWNIGDSYSATRWSNTPSTSFNPSCADIVLQKETSLPPKNLCLIPFRIAIAAQEDGWWVRSVIIWSKPNPMPESVTDRPTESHEYILMLTKSARYYWDADAVREAHSRDWSQEAWTHQKDGLSKASLQAEVPKYGEAAGTHRGDKTIGETYNPAGRNIRTVWEFPTQPYPEAHFAVFPEKLPELCIKAATPEVGCCSNCGAPWERIMEKREYPPEVFTKARRPVDDLVRSSPMADGKGSGSKMQKWLDENPLKTLGWQPTCKCNADKVPSLVLDPFAGAGTTLWVAKKLNRRAVGYEISEEYCDLALERNRQQVLI